MENNVSDEDRIHDILSASSTEENEFVLELQSQVKDLQLKLASRTDELNELREKWSSSAESKNKSEDGENGGTSSQAKLKPVPPAKSGYLFKWRDRSIGWGGTKWALRFVKLERGNLSYYSGHDDVNSRYVMTLRRCAVKDDGFKPNKKHKTWKNATSPTVDTIGAYFHVFSVYQRPLDSSNGILTADADNDNEDNIVPLLRFSTGSQPEKRQWIELISESCAYCDSEDFADDMNSAYIAQQEALVRMISKMPETMPGRLPPLIFGSIPKKPKRNPSGHGLSSAKSYQKLSTLQKDSAKSNPRQIAVFPPSKPMHRAAEPSFLSENAPKQNYRGLFNLAMILLVVSNFRLLVDTMRRNPFLLLQALPDISTFWQAPLTNSPLMSGFVLLVVFVLGSYFIEFSLSRSIITEKNGMILHMINSNLALLVPTLIVWFRIDAPVEGATLLMHGAITWLKLLSYAHANSDYRTAPERDTLALVQNLDEMTDDISYPTNVTLSNLLYFWLAPTLTYQIAFPRTNKISPVKVLSYAGRLIIAGSALIFLVAQVMAPHLDNMLKELEESGGGLFSLHIFADYLLRLAIANTYAWLLVFYGYFHLYLNLWAELLRFGDRVFYKDWWNSSEVSSYWRLWNMPVHYWLIRHLYFPCIRAGMSRFGATFMVFFVSALVHELLISVPFHMIRFWSFFGMMLQLPLVAVTKYFDKRHPGSSVGNVIFWMSFCILGQPSAILCYTIDYWQIHSKDRLDQCHAAAAAAAGGSSRSMSCEL